MPIAFKYCLPFCSSGSPITDWKRGEGNPRSVTTSPGGDVTAHHSQSMWSGTLPKPGDNKSISPRYSELCQHACTGEPSGGVDGWINGGVTNAACVGKVTEKAQFQQPVSAPCCHRWGIVTGIVPVMVQCWALQTLAKHRSSNGHGRNMPHCGWNRRFQPQIDSIQNRAISHI